MLLDCSNPVGPGFRLLTEGGPSAAQQLAAAAPGARVVKAFNLCHEDVWRMRPPVFDGRPLAVPVCGDDETALVRVRELVQDVGFFEPVAAGGLERAGLLEATAALFIALWVGEGADAQAIAPPLAFAAGPSRPSTEAGATTAGLDDPPTLITGRFSSPAGAGRARLSHGSRLFLASSLPLPLSWSVSGPFPDPVDNAPTPFHHHSTNQVVE